MKTQRKKIDLEKYYEEFLNTNFDPLVILEIEYQLGSSLKKIDYIHFRTACLDYLDSQIKDGIWVEIDGEVYEQ